MLETEAIAYAYSLLPRLSIYMTDARYRIDDNPAENIIRPLAIGRKNCLFCGNKAAAYRTAIVYSLISCCKTQTRIRENDRKTYYVVFRRMNQEKGTPPSFCPNTGMSVSPTLRANSPKLLEQLAHKSPKRAPTQN